MLAALRTIGWLACVVYASIPLFWLLIHPWVDFWRSRRRSPYRLLLPVWVGIWVVLGTLTAPWRRVMLYANWWSWAPAALLLVAGLSLYKLSGLAFAWAQLAGLPEVLPGRREQRLVTTGIHAWVRHPIYLAHLCGMLAWSVGTGLTVCYGLVAFAVVTGAVMIRMEDGELAKRFGEEYRRYRREVPAMFPQFKPWS
jgi:protein-S-isoprenylcysteine O-methyltransferase Ste14